LTLDEQLLHFDRNFDKAYARCLKDFKVRKEAIRSEARQRMIEGFPVYGAEGFGWDYARLRAARLEEYADGVNYQLMSQYQGWQ
jgi:hypothetical protein